MFHVILFRPEIPPNTGNLIRLCANAGATLHLVHPLGFELSDAHVRRAGLDYHEMACVREHPDLDACLAELDSARVFTIYALDRGPKKPVTRADAARAAAAGQFRPWDKLLARELRDFETSDYAQSLAMAAFLLEDQPAKFLALVERLAQGESSQEALEAAYDRSASELDAACTKWLARR